jgi:xanthine dehydrogenase D subunit
MSIGTARPTRGGVGDSARRLDGVPKVKGAFAFGSDLWAEGMLWGHTLRSPHPHARIRAIDVSRALAGPGVHAVLLAGDVPGKKTYGLEFADQPVLAWDRVRYAGEPVAVVAAVDPEVARRAAERIVVDYEVLPAVSDMEDALRADAPQIHDFGNVLRHLRVEHGDPGAPAEVWVEGYYETGMQDQAFLGPESGLAIPAGDGGVDLYVATQWLHVDRQQIAPCLNLPPEKVRLTLAGVGGAFGAREDVSMHVHACMLALRTGRPVKMMYGREESFHGHVHRHPSRIWMRHGAARDGRLVNIYARVLLDGGAFASSSSAVISNAATFAAGPYEVPNARVEATCVYTNNPPCGAMRGFGAPQVCFAYEAQMDKLARTLGIDPIALRLKNVVANGSTTITGQVIKSSAPVRELIERCLAVPLPDEGPAGNRDPLSLPGGSGNVSRGESIRRGVGFALGHKNIAYSGGFDDSSEARVRLFAGPWGATVEVHSAAADVGEGIHTVLAQIARTELGVEHVVLHPVDTQVGSAGSTSASRQTMMSGGAVHLACLAVRDALFSRIWRRAEAAKTPLRGLLALADGQVTAGGTRVGAIEDYLEEPIERTRTYHHRTTEALDEKGRGDVHVTLAFAAQRAVVDVDTDLGLVKVVHVTSAHDVGRVMNPQGLEGQVEGGTAMGLGFALMEEIQVQDGRIRNASFTDYLIPTILDMPPVSTVVVEDPEPGVPYGAKGMAELPTVVSTPAVVAALRNATGRDLNRVPVKPDDLIGLSPPVTSAGPPPEPDVPGPEPVPHYHGLGAGQQELMAPGQVPE